jgi:hypothetical protein
MNRLVEFCLCGRHVIVTGVSEGLLHPPGEICRRHSGPIAKFRCRRNRCPRRAHGQQRKRRRSHEDPVQRWVPLDSRQRTEEWYLQQFTDGVALGKLSLTPPITEKISRQAGKRTRCGKLASPAVKKKARVVG